MENQTNFLKEIQVKKTNDEPKTKYTEYFTADIKPTTWNNQLDKNNCIHIIGDLNPVKFMNALMSQNKLFMDLMVEPKKEELEFLVSNDDLEILTMITIKLYQSTDGYIIGFIIDNSGDENIVLKLKNGLSKCVEEMLC